jgi:hypothetical protein
MTLHLKAGHDTIAGFTEQTNLAAALKALGVEDD